MRFSTIINSFRGGLAHPIYRARTDVEALQQSCEELSNFHVISSGGATRRRGANVKPFYVNDTATTQVLSHKQLATDGEAIGLYKFNLLGQNYYFFFDTGEFFNATETRKAGSDPLYPTYNFTSKYLRIFDESGNEYSVKLPNNSFPKMAVNANYDSYYQVYYPKQLNYTQHTSRTVVFCDPSGNLPPFSVSLMDFPDAISGTYRYYKTFFMYPWSWSFSFALQDWNTVARPIPIVPLNYPYNIPNVDAVLDAYIDAVGGGGEPTTGTRYLSTNDFDRVVSLPQEMFPESQVLAAGTRYGAMIKMATTDGKEATYFLTKVIGTSTMGGEPYVDFTAIGMVGGPMPVPGVPSVYTRAFTISSWNHFQGFPKCVNTYRGRVVFGSNKSDPHKVWISSASDQDLANYQNMMQIPLLQDQGATDVSKLKCFDILKINIRAFEIGISDGNSGAVQWIKSKRNIHLGTDNGEHQISFPSGIVAFGEHVSNKVGSHNSSNVQPVEGDRKIFYVSDDGASIRSISTEDKDVDSIDEEMSILVWKFPYSIEKLAWCERLKSLFVACRGPLTEYEIYSGTIDEQTKVLAFSKFNHSDGVKTLLTTKGITDFFTDESKIDLVMYQDATHFRVEQIEYMAPNDFLSSQGATQFLDCNHNLSNPLGDYYEQFRGETLVAVINTTGVLTNTTFVVPIGYNAGDSLSFVPANTIWVGKKYLSKLKTFPIEQGAQYGTAIGDVKRIHRGTALLYNSGKAKMGSDDSTLYDLEELNLTTMKTLNHKHDMPDSPDTLYQCVIQTDEPVPLNISGIALSGISHSGE